MSPVVPGGQLQEKPATRSVQVPPAAQGERAQSFVFTSQFLPSYPACTQQTNSRLNLKITAVCTWQVQV